MKRNLPKPLRKGPFTYQEALQCGLTQYSLSKLTALGEVERIERGLYQAVRTDLSEEELYRRATKKVGAPAVVCLLSALSHYDLTDTIPKQVWLMVPMEKRTKSPHIKLYRSREPNWNKGVHDYDGYSITNLERTIIDSLTTRKLLSPRLGIDALKRAVASGQTTAGKVLKMAEMLGVKHRILSYVEVIT